MRLTAAISALFVATALASANTKAYTTVVSTGASDHASISLPMFNRSLGTLTSATVHYSIVGDCFFGMEQLSPNPAPGPYFFYSGESRAKLTSYLAFGLSPLYTGATRYAGSNAYDFDFFDGTIDYTGSSGIYTVVPVNLSGTVTYTDAPLLDSFVGSGLVSGVVGYNQKAQVLPAHPPKGNLLNFFSGESGTITARVVYTYTPVK